MRNIFQTAKFFSNYDFIFCYYIPPLKTKVSEAEIGDIIVFRAL